MALLDWTWSCSDWVLLLLFVGVVLYFLGTSNYNHFSKRNVPFVKPLPFVGSMGPAILRKKHLPQLILSIYNKLKEHPYGGFFIFKQPVVVLRDPQLIKAIAVKDFEYFMDHRSVLQEDGEPVWSRGLFSLKGKEIHVYIIGICIIYYLLCIQIGNVPSSPSLLQRVRRNADGVAT
jgi:hypothetical protein